MIHFHSYSTDVANVLCTLQKEQCWYVAAADNPPAPHAPHEILMLCHAGWADETDPVIIPFCIAEGQIIPDEATVNWIRFQNLVKQWKAHRGSRSSISQVAAMEPYQKIIGMGKDALPLIISQLKSEGDNPDQWFWALKAITSQDPVKPEERGNYKMMAQAWIDWAERNAW